MGGWWRVPRCVGQGILFGGLAPGKGVTLGQSPVPYHRAAPYAVGFMKHITDCAECQQLWHEYSLATGDHIRLDNKLGIAALGHKEASVSALTAEVEAALARRSDARRAIKAHEAPAHPSAHAAEA